MTHLPLNNVGVNIASTGQGDITFGSVIDPTYSTVAEAGGIDGNTFGYRLQENQNYEIGIATISDSGTVGARSVIQSSNSNDPIDLQGAALLFSVVLSLDVGPWASKVIGEP